MMAKQEAPFVADDRSRTAQSIDAIEQARAMLPGQRRTKAPLLVAAIIVIVRD
jgi:hypothetical protein